jgi:general stress protein 26
MTASNAKDIEKKFWKAVKSDMTMMLGLVGTDGSHMRPMTAQLDAEKGPIWFFGSKDSDLVKSLKGNHKAISTFTSKGNDLYATVHGSLKMDNDRTIIDKLWNPFVAAWYEGGKEDPKLALLRFDPTDAQVWLDGSSIMAGIKMLLGVDPKESYKDNVAELKLARK